MPDAARKDDPHVCPKVEPGPTPHVGGPIKSGSADVLIEFKEAARAGLDTAECKAGGPDTIQQGCGTVLINHMHAARVDDMTAHGGVIVKGASKVVIGVAGDAVTVGKIESPTDHQAEGKNTKGDADRGKNGDAKPGEKDTKKTSDGDGKSKPVGVISAEDTYVSTSRAFITSDSYDSFSPDKGGDAGISRWQWSVFHGSKLVYTSSESNLQVGAIRCLGDLVVSLVVWNNSGIQSDVVTRSIRLKYPFVEIVVRAFIPGSKGVLATLGLHKGKRFILGPRKLGPGAIPTGTIGIPGLDATVDVPFGVGHGTDNREWAAHLAEASSRVRLHAAIDFEVGDLMDGNASCDPTIVIDMETGKELFNERGSASTSRELIAIDGVVRSCEMATEAHNPYIYLSPDIDFECVVIADGNNRELRVNCLLDDFPAFESYLSVDMGPLRKVLTDYPRDGLTPWSLPGAANRQIAASFEL